MKIVTVAGARPNFMKIAPFLREAAKHPKIKNILLHTGQHYDAKMSETFFKELQIPEPTYNLGVGSGSHATQTAQIMVEFEKVCLEEKPDLVVVVGDVNSTLACGIVAKKLHIDLAHIESGLRSGDMDMPEEINRILTDRISDFLFVTEQSGIDNLKQEGTPSSKVYHVGNIMIDTLVTNLPYIKEKKQYETYKLDAKTYGLVTLHRPKNVDTKEQLTIALDILATIQKDTPLIWPIHPRTKNNINKFGLETELKKLTNITLSGPLGYHEFMSLVDNSLFVLTDSGGIQEETTYLRIPCITLRENTERPSTINIGTNVITGLNKEKIINNYTQIIAKTYKKGNIPSLWDGNTASRIVKIIQETYL